MSMAYYHSLGNLRISGLSNKLKNIHDYIDTILQILEWILIWPNSENKESTIMPYIIINTNETNRLYIIKSSQIVSFAFPLNLIEKTTGWKIHCMDLELTSSIITIAKTISEECRKNPTVPYSIIAENYDRSDSDQYGGIKLYEKIAFSEPAYLRYDFDPKSYHEKKHPINHLDINFIPKLSYKIGLYKKIEIKDFEQILFPKTSCWFIKHGDDISLKRLDLKNKFSNKKHRIK